MRKTYKEYIYEQMLIIESAIDEYRLDVMFESTNDPSQIKNFIQKIFSPFKRMMKATSSAMDNLLEKLKSKKKNVKPVKTMTESSNEYTDSLKTNYNDVVYIATQKSTIITNVHDLLYASDVAYNLVDSITAYLFGNSKQLELPEDLFIGRDGKPLRATTLEKGDKIGSGMFDDRVYSYSIILHNLRLAENNLAKIDDKPHAAFNDADKLKKNLEKIKKFTSELKLLFDHVLDDMRVLASFQASNLPVFDKRTHDGRQEGPLDTNIKAKVKTESIIISDKKYNLIMEAIGEIDEILNE